MLLPELSWSDRFAVLLLCLVMFTSGADLLIMTPILPQIAAELGVGIELAGLWVTAYSVSTAGFALVFGPISDRVGRRPILITGIAVLSGGTVACGLANGYAGMLAARMLAGAGAGLLVTSTTSFVADHFDSRHRAIVMGYVMSGFFLSLILAVPIGAFLAGAFGWQNMFFTFTGFALLVAAGLFGLPKPRAEMRTTTLSVGAALTSYGQLLKDRRVVGILLMSAAIGASMTMFSVYSSPWMEQTYGLDTMDRGLVYAVGGPAVLFGGPIAGRLSNHFGRVALIVSGSVVMGLMQIAMPMCAHASAWIEAYLGPRAADFATFGAVAWPIALPPLVVFFCAMMAGSSRSGPFQTLALEVVDAKQRGALAAIRNSFNHGGSGIGAALGSAVWAGASEPYLTVCAVAAGLTVVGVVLLMTLVGRDRPLNTA